MSQLAADSFIAEINSSEEFHGLLRFWVSCTNGYSWTAPRLLSKTKSFSIPMQRGVTTERSGGRPRTDVDDNQLDMEKCGEDNQSWIFFHG